MRHQRAAQAAVIYIIAYLALGATLYSVSALPGVIVFSAPAFAWSGGSAGMFYLSQPCTYTGWHNDTGAIHYTAFTMTGSAWANIGFSADTAGKTMTVTALTDTTLTYSQTGPSTQRVYSPALGVPTSCTGGVAAWDAPTSTSTIITVGSGVVTLIWGAAVPAVLVDPVVSLFASGDAAGAIAYIYTSVLGPIFYGLVVFLVMLPIYFKTQSIVLPLGVAILLSGLVEVILPAPAIDFARFMAILGIAAGLFLLVTRGRNS